MATTRLMPLHTGKGRTVGQAISDILDYSITGAWHSELTTGAKKIIVSR